MGLWLGLSSENVCATKVCRAAWSQEEERCGLLSTHKWAPSSQRSRLLTFLVISAWSSHQAIRRNALTKKPELLSLELHVLQEIRTLLDGTSSIRRPKLPCAISKRLKKSTSNYQVFIVIVAYFPRFRACRFGLSIITWRSHAALTSCQDSLLRAHEKRLKHMQFNQEVWHTVRI